jgi:hypothetical protein
MCHIVLASMKCSSLIFIGAKFVATPLSTMGRHVDSKLWFHVFWYGPVSHGTQYCSTTSDFKPKMSIYNTGYRERLGHTKKREISLESTWRPIVLSGVATNFAPIKIKLEHFIEANALWHVS